MDTDERACILRLRLRFHTPLCPRPETAHEECSGLWRHTTGDTGSAGDSHPIESTHSPRDGTHHRRANIWLFCSSAVGVYSELIYVTTQLALVFTCAVIKYIVSQLRFNIIVNAQVSDTALCEIGALICILRHHVDFRKTVTYLTQADQ